MDQINSLGEQILIEVVAGGFILTYPVLKDGKHVADKREVFVSPRKLNQKLKEIIESLSLVPDSAE